MFYNEIQFFGCLEIDVLAVDSNLILLMGILHGNHESGEYLSCDFLTKTQPL